MTIIYIYIYIYILFSTIFKSVIHILDRRFVIVFVNTHVLNTNSNPMHVTVRYSGQSATWNTFDEFCTARLCCSTHKQLIWNSWVQCKRVSTRHHMSVEDEFCTARLCCSTHEQLVWNSRVHCKRVSTWHHMSVEDEFCTARLCCSTHKQLVWNSRVHCKHVSAWHHMSVEEERACHSSVLLYA